MVNSKKFKSQNTIRVFISILWIVLYLFDVLFVYVKIDYLSFHIHELTPEIVTDRNVVLNVQTATEVIDRDAGLTPIPHDSSDSSDYFDKRLDELKHQRSIYYDVLWKLITYGACFVVYLIVSFIKNHSLIPLRIAVWFNAILYLLLSLQ